MGAQTVTATQAATVVGSTTISTGSFLVPVIRIEGGTLSIDPAAAPTLGPVSVQAASSLNIGIRLNSGSVTLLPGTLPNQTIQIIGPTSNVPAIWAQNGQFVINASPTGVPALTVTSNNVGRGLYATVGGQIIANGTALTANYGAIADSGGSITIGSGSSVTLNSTTGLAFGAIGNGTSVALTDAGIPVTVNGGQSVGAYMLNGGQVRLPAGTTLTFSGAASDGIIADATTVTSGTIGSGLTINFNAAPASTSSVGLIALNGGDLSVDSVHIGASGATSNTGIGAWARPGSTITLTGNSDITITDGQGSPNFRVLPATASVFYTTSGGTSIGTITSLSGNVTSTTNPAGLLADSGTINSTGSTITVTDTGGSLSYGMASRRGLIDFTTNQVTVSGGFAAGLTVIDFGTITGRDSRIEASGGSAALFYQNFLTGGGDELIALTNTVTQATGPDTVAVVASGGAAARNTLTVSGGSLSSESTAILAFTNLEASFTNGAVVTGGSLLVDVRGSASVPSLVNLAADNSRLFGDAIAVPAATLNLALQNNAEWTGASLRTNNVSVDATSTWNVTANSLVANTVTNAGLVQFTPPVGGIFKTLTTTNYVAGSGTIGLNTFLGTDGSPSDVLIINGGTTTGTSALRITNAGGPGALTVANGILVVDTINGGTTGATAFTLAGPVVAGPYEYTLHRSSIDATNGQAWFLRSTLECSLPNAPSPPCPAPAPPGPPPAPPVPNFRPETSLYTAVPAMALLYGRNLLDTFHERVGEHDDPRGGSDPDFGNGAWGRVIGMHGRREGHRTGIFGDGPRYTYDFFGLQLGHDLYRRDHDGGGRDHAGIYGAFGYAHGRVKHFDGSHGDSDFRAYSLGAYWTHFGASAWYVDAILQGTFYDITSNAHRGVPKLTTDGWGIAASLEGGYPFRFDNGFFLEPQAQLVYQYIDLADGSDAGARVRFTDVQSLAGRIGMRIGKTWIIDADAEGGPRRLTAWFRPNLWHEFLGNPKTSFSSDTGFVPFRADLGGTWLELNAGISGKIGRSTSLYANVSYQTRFRGNSYAYNGKIGLRMSW